MNPQTPHISNTNSTKALQLAATAKSNALMYAVLATAISRDEDVEAMCQSVGMRYGQIRLLAAGDHDAASQVPEFYRACATYIGCSALTAKILAGALRADDVTGGEPDGEEIWQKASKAADKLAIWALQAIAESEPSMQTYQIPLGTAPLARQS
jgi:hypothetical protein